MTIDRRCSAHTVVLKGFHKDLHMVGSVTSVLRLVPYQLLDRMGTSRTEVTIFGALELCRFLYRVHSGCL
jgi:hypothetical protein